VIFIFISLGFMKPLFMPVSHLFSLVLSFLNKKNG